MFLPWPAEAASSKFATIRASSSLVRMGGRPWLFIRSIWILFLISLKENLLSLKPFLTSFMFFCCNNLANSCWCFLCTVRPTPYSSKISISLWPWTSSNNASRFSNTVEFVPNEGHAYFVAQRYTCIRSEFSMSLDWFDISQILLMASKSSIALQRWRVGTLNLRATVAIGSLLLYNSTIASRYAFGSTFVCSGAMFWPVSRDMCVLKKKVVLWNLRKNGENGPSLHWNLKCLHILNFGANASGNWVCFSSLILSIRQVKRVVSSKGMWNLKKGYFWGSTS